MSDQSYASPISGQGYSLCDKISKLKGYKLHILYGVYILLLVIVVWWFAIFAKAVTSDTMAPLDPWGAFRERADPSTMNLGPSMLLRNVVDDRAGHANVHRDAGVVSGFRSKFLSNRGEGPAFYGSNQTLQQYYKDSASGSVSEEAVDSAAASSERFRPLRRTDDETLLAESA